MDHLPVLRSQASTWENASEEHRMSVAMVVAVVLLPVAMYGLASLLAGCRDWPGVTGAPRTRNLVRSIRLTPRARVQRSSLSARPVTVRVYEETLRTGDAAHSGWGCAPA
jgi:hypothetical protein